MQHPRSNKAKTGRISFVRFATEFGGSSGWGGERGELVFEIKNMDGYGSREKHQPRGLELMAST